MKYTINDIEYELIKNYREGFNLEEIENKYTDYFKDYDYLFGDWAYGKLRLKGFNEKNNKKINKINDISNLEKYLEEYCATDCRYFLLKKLNHK